jgi:hypothetical protein
MNEIVSKNEMIYARVLARAWSDPAFMDRLRDDPAAVLAESGMDLTNVTAVSLAEGAVQTAWSAETGAMVLPLPDRPADLDDSALNQVSPARSDNSVTACCCCCCT